MKKYCKSILVLVVSLTCLAACKKVDFNYRQFVDSGETIYIGKADSVLVRGGNQRVEVSWLLLSDPKVHHYKLYWNNKQDSISAEVNKTARVDTVRVMLNDMREGTHHFEILMFDQEGHSSVPTRASGRVYGAQYNEFLVNRVFNAALLIDQEDLEIKWVPAEASLIYSEINYTDIDGKDIKYKVESEADIDTLKKFPLNGTFTMFSAYKPDSMALDTFYSQVETIAPFGVE